jgi:hypothetical protein
MVSRGKRNKAAFKSTVVAPNVSDYENYRSSSWDGSGKLTKAQLEALQGRKSQNNPFLLKNVADPLDNKKSLQVSGMRKTTKITKDH